MILKICALISMCMTLQASLTTHIGEHSGWTSLYSLPQEEIDHHFFKVKEAVDYRWDFLTEGMTFPLYTPGREESSLVEEFYHFSQMRVKLWLENPDHFPCRSSSFFKISQAHVLNGRFRQPCCITFEHSATDSSYNATSLSIGKRRFFAMEGPIQEHVPYFLRLLTNWSVAYVVCLTDEKDAAGTPKCHPYWQDYQKGDVLSIPVEGAYELSSSLWSHHEIPYLFWPEWEDHHGISPEELVEAANQVRKSVGIKDIIGVHCSAGVGRTGTFIAAITLLDAIDEKLSQEGEGISIAELFLYLNFHRPWLIAKPSQYITLYHMVEWYLKNLSYLG